LVLSTLALAADPPSTSVVAELAKEMHVKRVKVGDKVYAKITKAIVLKDGQKLKDGTKLVGHVTKINIKASKESPSQLGLVFDKVLIGSEEVPISLVLVGAGPSIRPSQADVRAGNGDMNSSGRMSSMASDTGRSGGGTDDAAMKGLTSTDHIDASLGVGVSNLDDITLSGLTPTDPGTIFESKKTQIFLDGGTRFLFYIK
jgi:hypothetical protein